MNKLKFLRLALGYTQADLERMSEVERWKISIAEGGAQKISKEEMDRIAAVFEVPSNELLEEMPIGISPSSPKCGELQ